MKQKSIIAITLLTFLFSNNAMAKSENEEFINKNHLGLSISNIMLKGSFSRDLNKDFELGLNAYYGFITNYDFYDRTNFLNLPDVDIGFTIETNLKNYFRRELGNNFYIKYFIGMPITKERNRNISRNSSSFYIGSGIGFKKGDDFLSFNAEADLGLNTDILNSSVAFTLFPRFSAGVEMNF